jgi:hypothetical protein
MPRLTSRPLRLVVIRCRLPQRRRRGSDRSCALPPVAKSREPRAGPSCLPRARSVLTPRMNQQVSLKCHRRRAGHRMVDSANHPVAPQRVISSPQTPQPERASDPRCRNRLKG